MHNEINRLVSTSAAIQNPIGSNKTVNKHTLLFPTKAVNSYRDRQWSYSWELLSMKKKKKKKSWEMGRYPPGRWAQGRVSEPDSSLEQQKRQQSFFSLQSTSVDIGHLSARNQYKPSARALGQHSWQKSLHFFLT